jgi:DNA-binding MarR family transcriptional regulator
MKRARPSAETIAQNCIAVRLRLLNRVVTALYDEALRPLGLKVSQLNILVATAKLGKGRPAAVCRILQLDPSTLSRNVERMKARGWLEIVPDDDVRAQPFRLTSRGEALIQKAMPAWRRAQRHAEALLGEDGIAFLDRTATKHGFPKAGRQRGSLLPTQASSKRERP